MRPLAIDGNEAAASVAHRTNEVIAIYPITPSSTMGELADAWSAAGRRNIWGAVPQVVEMQSEAGAAGAVHGALQAGALTTTFTASQGLLLMLPNMYKIAGELNAFCMHVAARTVATHALSIFGDHSDVMACRQTGFALLASGSVQEAHDFAAIAQATTLQSRIPFLHFFDGFRTSHEVAKVHLLSDDDLRALMSDEGIRAHRSRALTPERPVLRGTAQNPDTFFQAREACNPFYAACPTHVERAMAAFAARTGRPYHLFDYVGHPDATHVVVLMGSGAETAHETVEYLLARGERVGCLKVRLFRPFAVEAFVAALPSTVQSIAVLDRTKEPGAIGEPLYQDVITALREAYDSDSQSWTRDVRVIGGRYGLSSKEFTPAMVKAVFDELSQRRPRNHFTVGIDDDVTKLSLSVDARFDIEPDDVARAVFFGLGADGTVGANKNSIKIIGEETDNYAQGYFVYDSKKSGAMTISHLRFGPRPIRSSYLVRQAKFVACHHFPFLEKIDVLAYVAEGGVLLLNTTHPPETVWDALPRAVQSEALRKRLRLFVINAYDVAAAAGMGRRINTVMQVCFFAISGVLPRDKAIAKIRGAIEKTYAGKGAKVVERNVLAIETALAALHEVAIEGRRISGIAAPPTVPDEAPAFIRNVTAAMLAGRGDTLPVSAFTPDGTWPVGTSRWEKRNIALEIPEVDRELCIQCNKCVLICPHAAIRAKIAPTSLLSAAPTTFHTQPFRSRTFQDHAYALQVATEDCTGCSLCVEICPAHDKADPAHKALNMHLRADAGAEAENFRYFLGLPDADRTRLKTDVKESQLRAPLFEFSGACSGCGETPYVKLLTQLFGDRAYIANATGCSSIYGGNLPTTPYTTDGNGRGPAWSNSLFEDNAEFGFGFRLAVDAHREQAAGLARALTAQIGESLVDALLSPGTRDDSDITAQRERVRELRARLGMLESDDARRLADLADSLVPRSVWLVGGDGWAYDIGYGGLDHVLAMGRKVNILVLDTEVYSNTGGQQSKSTPFGATAKFASAGKALGKKNLGLMAMTYGHAYVAQIAMGANDAHTVKVFLEAESYPGPSLIIAYSPCIAHGYDLSNGLVQQQRAVASGMWPLYRFDPRRMERGQPPLQIDCAPPSLPVADFMRSEQRFTAVEAGDPARFATLLEQAQQQVRARDAILRQLAKVGLPAPEPTH